MKPDVASVRQSSGGTYRGKAIANDQSCPYRQLQVFCQFRVQARTLAVGSGTQRNRKTVLFDVLDTLRGFVCDGPESRLAFPGDTLTAWEARSEQTFELGVRGNGGQYDYRLVIEHDRGQGRNRIKSERLTFDGKPLYEFDGNDAHLYRDDFSAGPVFPFDWTRSAIATVPERNDNRLLIWFRERLSRVLVFAPDPLGMSPRSETELDRPDRALHQIVSWLRHLSQESLDVIASLRDDLRDDVIEGLKNMKLEKVSDTTRTLKFEFEFAENGRGKPFELLWTNSRPDNGICLHYPQFSMRPSVRIRRSVSTNRTISPPSTKSSLG